MRVLVIANSARSIACSAKRAGCIVYALDRFGDVDTRQCAKKFEIITSAKEKRLHELVDSFGEVDAVILGPGFEHIKLKNAFINAPEVIEEAGDKSKLPERLKSMGVPHPETESVNRAESLGFPLVIKPKFGSGGVRNMIIRTEDELILFREREDACEFIAQEFVEGIPCSASLISTGDKAVVVALNEQLIGMPWLTRLPFAYCGNITPFHTKFDNEMAEYAEKIALEFKLMGSNGIDFILTEKGATVIEVNPRFQGSLDTIELATGMNIFDSHIKSFGGELQRTMKPVCFAAKAIVYANKQVVIGRRISEMLKKCMDTESAADIPQYGAMIQPDEPITTMLATAETSSLVLKKVRESSFRIKDMTEG